MRDADELKEHPFFSTINWEDVELKKIAPPINPLVKSEDDYSNFNKNFLLDSISENSVKDDNLKKDNYDGFTYVSSNDNDDDNDNKSEQ